MQAITSFGTEILNILFMCTLSNLQDIITNNLFLTFIINIDDMVASLQRNTFVCKIVEEQPININPYENNRLRKMDHNEGKPGWQIAIFIYKVLRVFYNSVYFYFMPFFVVFWPLLRH